MSMTYMRSDYQRQPDSDVPGTLPAFADHIISQARSVCIRAPAYPRCQREHEAVTAVAAALRNAPPLPDMLALVLDQIDYALRPQASGFVLSHHHTGAVEFTLARGAWADRTGSRLTPGTGMSGLVLTTGQPYIGQTPFADLRLSRPDLMAGITSAVGVPLVTQESTVGMLSAGFTRKTTSDDMRLLTTLADLAASAIYQHQVREQAVQAAVQQAQTCDAVLTGLIQALSLRDSDTGDHSQRVLHLSLRLAQVLGITEHDLAPVRRGVLLHDIGKLCVPDSILLKPGPLTDDEWVIMRQHPLYARQLLSSVQPMCPTFDIPAYHHEKWDGSGYPFGLKGAAIPLAARVFAIVDVWDALSSDRPYRRAWSPQQVRTYICEQAGSHFDPRVAEAFLHLLNEEDDVVL